MSALPRPVRLNNPLDIRRDGTQWEGMAENQPDPDFVHFDTMAWGFRAAFKILISYADKYHIDTVNGVCSRWAPTSENDTKAYIDAVCKRTGFAATETINIKSWADASKLLYAMAEVECGATFETYYKPAQLAEGAYRAGIVDAPKTPIKKIGVVLTGAGAAAASAAPSAIDAFTQYKGLFDIFDNPTFRALIGAVGAILAVLAIINHIRASK